MNSLTHLLSSFSIVENDASKCNETFMQPYYNQRCRSASWKRLNFSGSILKKEAGSESIFHKIWDRDVEAEAL